MKARRHVVHRHEFKACRFRDRSLWDRLRIVWRYATPRIDLGNWP